MIWYSHSFVFHFMGLLKTLPSNHLSHRHRFSQSSQVKNYWSKSLKSVILQKWSCDYGHGLEHTLVKSVGAVVPIWEKRVRVQPATLPLFIKQLEQRVTGEVQYKGGVKTGMQWKAHECDPVSCVWAQVLTRRPCRSTSGACGTGKSRRR